MKNFYQDFIDAALADGWEEHPHGVWGIQKQPLEPDEKWGQFVTIARREGDRTVRLRKNDVVLWFVDRDTTIGDRPPRRETWTKGWFRNGRQGMVGVPETYSAEAIEALRGNCTVCEKPGDPDRLKMLGFAGRVCPDCDTGALRAKVEFPGWTD